MAVLFNRQRKPRRMLVIGLDCASPELVFDQFKADLPTLSHLARNGTWGELASCIPCITIPAWSSMLTSRDPGVLGCYGFRNRADYSYRRMITADSAAIRHKRVWDYVGDAGRQSLVIGVPQTYPPRALNGHLVSDFLTPGIENAFTYPAILKQEVLSVTPDYRFDVQGFRTDDKARLRQQLMDLAEVQFRLVGHLLTTKPWDFAMYVNIGVDRVHHGFWRYHDPQHRLHEPGSPFAHTIRDYYKMMDTLIGGLLERAGQDTTVLIVSDHGVSRMDGGVCLNEWLWRAGWLTFRTPPPDNQLTAVDDTDIDWSRTRAWGSGGYYGRVFLNVADREPQGVIPRGHYQAVRDELAAALAHIPGPQGQTIHSQVFQPEAIYREVRSFAPDLMLYFGDLHWRSVGSLGHGQHYTFDNDTGPDDANHAVNGLFILYAPGRRGAGQVSGHQLMDIAPTLLAGMGLPVPPGLQGRLIS